MDSQNGLTDWTLVFYWNLGINVGLDLTLGLVWTLGMDLQVGLFELRRQHILHVVCESIIIIISSLMSPIQEFKSTSQSNQSNPKVYSIGPVK